MIIMGWIVVPKKICPYPKSWNPWLWSYLEKGSLYLSQGSLQETQEDRYREKGEDYVKMEAEIGVMQP